MVPPLLIAGMHRSGTSATARLLQRAGLDVGQRLLGPSLDNVTGYYEDRDFSELNLRLVSEGVGDPSLHPDWAHPERISPARLRPHLARATELVEAAGSRDVAWGFKDPRTSVLLDFWLSAAPQARFLFVYREPWDVLRSLMRARHRQLHGKADVAVAAWTHYNRELLRFREAHPDRTVLVHVDGLRRDPTRVVELVQERADPTAPCLDAGAVADAVDASLLHRSPPEEALAELVAADHPETVAVLAMLESAADLPGRRPRPDHGTQRVDVEDRRGSAGLGAGLGAVLAGGPADGLEETGHIARPVVVSDPCEAADAGIEALADDLVVVVFAGQTRPAALPLAVAALDADQEVGAVLLGAGAGPLPAVPHDPLVDPVPTPAVVVRRSTWLARRGFTGIPSRPGAEAWAFAVACLAGGERVSLVPGAVHLPDAEALSSRTRRAVLEAHPRLVVRRLEEAQAAQSTRGVASSAVSAART